MNEDSSNAAEKENAKHFGPLCGSCEGKAMGFHHMDESVFYLAVDKRHEN
jgi:hypothetical protein